MKRIEVISRRDERVVSAEIMQLPERPVVVAEAGDGVLLPRRLPSDADRTCAGEAIAQRLPQWNGIEVLEERLRRKGQIEDGQIRELNGDEERDGELLQLRTPHVERRRGTDRKQKIRKAEILERPAEPIG